MREALSATMLALMNRIRNCAEHCSMLVSATASERCSRQSYSASKHDIPKAQEDPQVSHFDVRASSLLNGTSTFNGST